MISQVSLYQMRLGDRIQNFNAAALLDGRIVMEVKWFPLFIDGIASPRTDPTGHKFRE